jgi:hypothetical protein
MRVETIDYSSPSLQSPLLHVVLLRRSCFYRGISSLISRVVLQNRAANWNALFC